MLAGNFRTRCTSIFTFFNKQGPSGVIQELITFYSRPAIFISITMMLLLDAPVSEVTHLITSARKHWGRTATSWIATKVNRSDVAKIQKPSRPPFILDPLPLPTR
jgi:hypothetical protein